MADIDKHLGYITVKKLERIVIVKHIGAAFGSAFIVSFIFLLIRLINKCECNTFYILIILFVLAISCVIQNKTKLKKNNEALENLSNRIILNDSYEKLLNKIKDNKDLLKKIKEEITNINNSLN